MALFPNRVLIPPLKIPSIPRLRPFHTLPTNEDCSISLKSLASSSLLVARILCFSASDFPILLRGSTRPDTTSTAVMAIPRYGTAFSGFSIVLPNLPSFAHFPGMSPFFLRSIVISRWVRISPGVPSGLSGPLSTFPSLSRIGA
ncbi:hypothetical protein D3C74_353540 [compost metagenome]